MKLERLSVSIPTTLLTDHHAVGCELRYGKPARQTHRVQYRKYSSIDQKAFTEDVRSIFATNLEKPVADCFAAYQDAVDKHAPTMTRVVTVRPKTPWHTQQLSDAKRNLRRAESRWRIVNWSFTERYPRRVEMITDDILLRRRPNTTAPW